MDKFFEAQRRFQQGSLFDGHAYARDMLVNYGDSGSKINLPTASHNDYDKALAFRAREKQHYKTLENTLSNYDAMHAELTRVTQELKESKDTCVKFANFINSQAERERKEATISRQEEKDVANTSNAGATSGSITLERVEVGGEERVEEPSDAGRAPDDAADGA